MTKLINMIERLKGSDAIKDMMRGELITNREVIDYLRRVGIEANSTAVHLARKALGRSVSYRTSAIDRRLAEKGKLESTNALALDPKMTNEAVRMRIKEIIGYAPHKSSITKWRRNKGFPVLEHGGFNSLRNVLKRKGAKPETIKAVYDDSVSPKDAAMAVYLDIKQMFLPRSIIAERRRK